MPSQDTIFWYRPLCELLAYLSPQTGRTIYIAFIRPSKTVKDQRKYVHDHPALFLFRHTPSEPISLHFQPFLLPRHHVQTTLREYRRVWQSSWRVPEEKLLCKRVFTILTLTCHIWPFFISPQYRNYSECFSCKITFLLWKFSNKCIFKSSYKNKWFIYYNLNIIPRLFKWNNIYLQECNPHD